MGFRVHCHTGIKITHLLGRISEPGSCVSKPCLEAAHNYENGGFGSGKTMQTHWSAFFFTPSLSARKSASKFVR